MSLCTINWPIHQKLIAILNDSEPNERALKYVEQKLTHCKEKCRNSQV